MDFSRRAESGLWHLIPYHTSCFVEEWQRVQNKYNYAPPVLAFSVSSSCLLSPCTVRTLQMIWQMAKKVSDQYRARTILLVSIQTQKSAVKQRWWLFERKWELLYVLCIESWTVLGRMQFSSKISYGLEFKRFALNEPWVDFLHFHDLCSLLKDS